MTPQEESTLKKVGIVAILMMVVTVVLSGLVIVGMML